jgi:hypothetical protein
LIEVNDQFQLQANFIMGKDLWLKLKVPHNRPKGPEGGRGVALLFLDLGTRRGWMVSTLPWPLYLGKTPYPLYRRLGGPQGWSGCVWKILSPPGFDPRTVQPVARRYTDWAILALKDLWCQMIFFLLLQRQKDPSMPKTGLV